MKSFAFFFRTMTFLERNIVIKVKIRLGHRRLVTTLLVSALIATAVTTALVVTLWTLLITAALVVAVRALAATGSVR